MLKLLMVTPFILLEPLPVVAADEPVVYVMPQIPDEETKILALKLGYALNGNSMVRYGSIDLSRGSPDPDIMLRQVPTEKITPTEKKKK